MNIVIEVDINIEKSKELEIIKKSYIFNTNENIFPAEEFKLIKPSSVDNME